MKSTEGSIMEDSIAEIGTMGNIAILIVTALTGGGGYRLLKTYLDYMKEMKGSASNELLERIEVLEKDVLEKNVVLAEKDNQITELVAKMSTLMIEIERSNNMVKALTAAIKAEMTPEQSAKFLENVTAMETGNE